MQWSPHAVLARSIGSGAFVRGEGMPTYNYACDRCKHEWELEQRITETSVTLCPKCQRKNARRMISNTTFALKGGGWYSDGYGAPKAKANE